LSLTKIEDIAHVRFAAPDLKEMERFAVAFGLTPVPGTGASLFCRGAGRAPVLHVTEEGEARFLAIGFRAESLSDLEKLSAAEGAPVEDLDWPGGGKVVHLVDPDGHGVDVVAGQTPAEALPLPPEPSRNTARELTRPRAPVRLNPGPSTVVRLGHAVLEVSDFRRSEAWYKARFGFITSDEVETGPDVAVGAFLRCDRGEAPTDHHTLFLLQSPRAPALNHAAFEVAHFDDLVLGHDHLKTDGRTPAWGIGRHILGSQIFDYWKDPFGNEVEHWTDGDRFNAADGSNKVGLEHLLGVQRGPRHPMTRGTGGDHA
jgi:catechol 2,3-dioxygenase-like lactoylglutathione lyase family enzyme